MIVYFLNSSQFNLYLVYDSLVANQTIKFLSRAFILFYKGPLPRVLLLENINDIPC